MVRLLIVLLVFSVSAARADVSGTAIIVDGDTLSIAGIKVRLNGIATPKKRSNG